MPKSKDERPKRKVTAMLPVELLDHIQGATNETDTRLLLRLVEQEAARLAGGGKAQAFVAGEDLRRLMDDVLRQHGLIPPAAPPKAPRSRPK